MCESEERLFFRRIECSDFFVGLEGPRAMSLFPISSEEYSSDGNCSFWERARESGERYSSLLGIGFSARLLLLDAIRGNPDSKVPGKHASSMLTPEIEPEPGKERKIKNYFWGAKFFSLRKKRSPFFGSLRDE